MPSLGPETDRGSPLPATFLSAVSASASLPLATPESVGKKCSLLLTTNHPLWPPEPTPCPVHRSNALVPPSHISPPLCPFVSPLWAESSPVFRIVALCVTHTKVQPNHTNQPTPYQSSCASCPAAMPHGDAVSCYGACGAASPPGLNCALCALCRVCVCVCASVLVLGPSRGSVSDDVPGLGLAPCTYLGAVPLNGRAIRRCDHPVPRPFNCPTDE